MLSLIYGLIESSTAGWTALPTGVPGGGRGPAGRVRDTPAPGRPAAHPAVAAGQPGVHRRAALALGPLMAGIIIASVVCRPLVGKLGRALVFIGLGVTLAGAAGLWATVLASGTAVSVWVLAPSVLVLGAGMGACFSRIYDVAIGDVAPAEAGSASGALSAVQQLAAAIGSAVVTTVYFSQRAEPGAGHAMLVSVAVVAAIAALCLGLAGLLPRSAPADEH
jgi:hypothetical protein